MCLTSETVEALHAITTELKETQEQRQQWLSDFDQDVQEPSERAGLDVTRAEGERIFADRLAALEARLREQGWERKIRVDNSGSAQNINGT